MKRFLITFLLFIGLVLPSVADDSGDSSSSGVNKITIKPSHPTSNDHRAPMRVNLEAYYYAETNLIVISYDGEATGEVTVYHDGEIVASDTELNTVLTIDGTPGLYTIEITTDSWTAVGSFEL